MIPMKDSYNEGGFTLSVAYADCYNQFVNFFKLHTRITEAWAVQN